MGKVIVGVRELVDSDRPYIVNTWRKSFWKADAPALRGMAPEVFFTQHGILIDSCLRRFTTVIAYDPAMPTNILAWANGDRAAGHVVLNYVYCNNRFRKLGITRKLVTLFGWKPGDPIVTTHWTTQIRKYSKYYPMLYNPYLAYDQFNKGERYEHTARFRPELPEGQILQFEGRARPNLKTVVSQLERSEDQETEVA